MRTVARRTCLVFLLGTSLAIGLAAQTAGGQEPAERPKGTGLLLGQVVDASSGRPVNGANVNITGAAVTSTVLPTGEILLSSPPPAAAGSAPRQLLADSQGRFLFRELTKGRYTIRVTAPGYLPGSYGQSRPAGASQSIELVSDDEKKNGLVIKMWKTASISGVVTDEAGEPVTNQTVRVIRRTMAAGVPRLAPGITAVTDDRGVYRFGGLTPGDYLVAIMSTQVTMPVATAEAYREQMMTGGSSLNSEIYRDLSSSGAPMPSMNGQRVGDLVLQTSTGRGGSTPIAPPAGGTSVFVFPTQYFPAAGVATQATVITLGSGEERTGIDLPLKLSRSVRVSGVVTGPDGPARNLGVKLIPAGAENFSSESLVESASTVTDANGVFTFLGVTAGQYTLKSLRIPRPATSASSTMSTTIEVTGPNGMIMGISSGGALNSATAPLPTDPTYWATMPLAVGDADVTGVAVSLRPGVRLSGRIEFDGATAKPTADQIQRISLGISSQATQVLSVAKKVEADGRFATVGYPPGQYTVSANIAGWTLRNVMLGGRDVSSEGLDVGAEDISGLVFTFTDRTNELSGMVKATNGGPDADASVIAFPADTDSWKRGIANARRLRLVRTTTTSAYSFPSLPSGDYFVVAISDSAVGEWQDPKFIETLLPLATRVTVAEGDKKTQDLATKTIR